MAVYATKLSLTKADYWKSQARKFCDFCKCWIADNKPSIDFHEKGRRHQDNVAKRLKSITKKSKRDEKEAIKVDAALRQMESAALEAYQRDVENNADLSSVLINKKLQEDNLAIDASEKKIWKEAKSADGRIYYWNEITNESAWEPPKEGFLSFAEQREQMDEETKKQLRLVQKQRQLDARIRLEEQKREDAETKAAAAREKMKEWRVAEEPEPTFSGPILPSGRTEPYGQWKAVETRTQPVVDLQLPKQEFEYIPVPVPHEAPVLKEFKEKIVESLGSGNATFKKRKFGSATKRNTRQRLDDD